MTQIHTIHIWVQYKIEGGWMLETRNADKQKQWGFYPTM